MDEFWEIAMEQQQDNHHRLVESSDDEAEPSRWMRYKLPTTTNNNTTDENSTSNISSTATLELQALAAKDGIWSPLGADAWYASALLATMFFQCEEEEGEDNGSSSILAKSMKGLQSPPSSSSSAIKILEIGSGAVGLSGLACAVALRDYDDDDNTNKNNNMLPWTLVMTDNDPAVLKQLRENVEHNVPRLDLDETKHKIVVESLDWNDDENNIICSDHIDLVIGSELVYSDETAKACTKLLLRLLRDNPSIRIFIVQVIDRYGWLDIVIPTLEQEVSKGGGGAIVQPVPISLQVHETACTMIPMGGTLDRHAYGAYMICNNTNSGHDVKP